ncbi:glycosyltransferase family 61 protein [Rhizobium sp.]|uniref:glycosyltransferase family 61 protein n=1 Tax=Rhizobium sp. TaxID=391 RepID=UPI00289A61FB
MDKKIYKVITCADLEKIERTRTGVLSWSPDIDVSIPAVSYGQIAPPDFPYWEWPPSNWYEASYSVLQAKHYILNDAKVHTETGVITVGDYCLKESLYLVFPDAQGWRWVSESELEIPVLPERAVEEGFHACCGWVGNRNYAHWWIDVVPVVGHQVLRKCFGNAKALLPQFRAKYQRQTLDIIPEVRDRHIEVMADECLSVGRLHFVPSLTGGDYHPQPWNSAFIQELKLRVGVDGARRGHRKIYLSRKDATARKMLNEDRISDLAYRHGFEVLETGGMDLKQQIQTFAQASHVISPHGAGLANLMFSAPGTKMLELHYDNSVNWSLRRMAAAANLSYGCLVGRQTPRQADQSEDAARENPWHLPEALFENVISTKPFI